jgi:hypothetical protein
METTTKALYLMDAAFASRDIGSFISTESDTGRSNAASLQV